MPANLAIQTWPRFADVPALPKSYFNGKASMLNLPFSVTGSLPNPAALSPKDLEFSDPTKRDLYVQDGHFTPEFLKKYREMVELQRRESVGKALAEGRTVVRLTDLSGLEKKERLFVSHIKVVAKLINDLYQKQEGTYGYQDQIKFMASQHPASARLFELENGPWATGSEGEKDPFACALPGLPRRQFGVLPPDFDPTPEALREIENNKELSFPFNVVVRDANGKLAAIPYTEFWKTEMQQIADELECAVRALRGMPAHATLVKYLKVTAKAFRGETTWYEADKAWVAMRTSNSKFAIRVAPDETYWSPGNTKAGFQLWFGLIDRTIEETLPQGMDEFFQQMENEIARLVPQYKPRQVKDAPLDFIDVVLWAGDHKNPRGATVGEKLPNFYKEKKDGSPTDDYSRQVVMTGYYTDEQSLLEAATKRALLFSASVLAGFQPNELHSHHDTYFHEKTHSNGTKSAETDIALNEDGTQRLDEEGNPLTVQKALGGVNSQVMEELKAQTGALYAIALLLKQGKITEQKAKDLYTQSVFWAFNHISKGMSTLDEPKTYSQLAAIQIRWLMDRKVITYDDATQRFDLNYELFPDAVEALFKEVNRIQILGDKEAATELRKDILEGNPGFELIHAKDVKERFSGFSTPSFQLQVKL